jgi:transporter family-2 protein
MKFFWIILALLSGAFLPIQAGLNSRLGKTLHNPVFASMISFVTGALAVSLYILLSGQAVEWEGVKKAPWYVWTAGVFGAFYVTVIILAFPRIGPALTFGLVVAGQMISAVLLDHFTVLVEEQHLLTIWRILGILLVVTGVILIRKV